MAIQVVSILTSTSGLTFNSVQEWLEHHGLIGQNSEWVQDSKIVLREDMISVERTLVYANEIDKQSHVGPGASNKPWIKELISETII
jgi:hypothetical protein